MKEKLLSHKAAVVSLVSLISLLFSACEFRVIKRPGPQVSWSIEQAKDNDTFISAYKIKDSTLNGIKINTIFAEKKYSSDGGLFSGFDMDCCKSQLVIVSNDYLASEGRGFGVDWDIPGFTIHGSKIIYRSYKGTIFPDSIPISVVSMKDKSVIEKLILYKVNTD